ncbi:MAG: hypothetical protein GKR93_14485 [Gammaproteobacteria bacterium]|nr:hypothetical protein [Gammaproteobacteria bacterium]
MDDNLKILVISDLHAHSLSPRDKESPSLLSSMAEEEPTKNPFTGFISLVNEKEISADILLCAGDICDKGDYAGMKYAWQKFHELGKAANTNHVYATAGNHDMDSRYKNSNYNAQGMLQSLVTKFPLDDEAMFNHYWARKYVITEAENWRLVLLNSAAYHGGGKDQGAEFEHGRISPQTVKDLLEKLRKSDEKKINILLTHHHLMRNTEIHENNYSEMQGADELLRNLSSGEYGEWLVIHGHMHVPNLNYSAGGSVAPLIFTAGSFSVTLDKESATKTNNQAYLVDLEMRNNLGNISNIAGNIHCWDWTYGMGWSESLAGSVFPNPTGFGFRGTINSLVDKINKLLNGDDQTYYKWDELLTEIPELNYVLHTDLKLIVSKLAKNNVEITEDKFGRIIEIGKK